MKTMPIKANPLGKTRRAAAIGAAAMAIGLISPAAIGQIQDARDVEVLIPQRDAGDQSLARISAVDVDVRLTDALATTHIEIRVENHGARRSQARLVLPVPPGSTIRSFGIDGIGDEPTATLLPRDEASRAYQEIVRRMVDPGLLEFVGEAMIRSSVFPVDPGQSRTMTIVYEQSLDAHKGRIEYVLPRSASYSDASIGWSIDLELESQGEMGPVFSPSHPIVSKPSGDHRMRVSVPVLDEPGPFRLYAVLAPESGATTLLYPDASDPGSGYFMFVADAPGAVKDGATLREITIVIDRSGSMGGEKIRQARESAKQIVRGMKPGESVRIIDYADDVRSFSDAPVVLTEQSVLEIAAYIDQIRSRGGTNLHDALIESLSAPVAGDRLPMVLFLTDGLASVGIRDEKSIRADARSANTHGRRVFTFGLGFDVNVPLLDGLAADTRAESTFVLPNEDVELKVGHVFDKLDGPVMIDPVFGAKYVVSCDTIPELRLIHPQELSDLFSGSRVLVLGRYEHLANEPAEMFVAQGLKRQNEANESTNALVASFKLSDASIKHAFVARLWAQQRINSLINQIRLAGADGTAPDQELVDEIVRLSLEHGIMSEYTAFLAREDVTLQDSQRRDADGRTQAQKNTTRNFTEQNTKRSGEAAYAQSANRQSAGARELQSAVDEAAPGSFLSDSTVQSTGSVKANTYYNENMEQVRIQTIQRGVGTTLYYKRGRWIDVELGDDPDSAHAEPDITISFGDEAYTQLLEDLARQGRQWILANRGDISFMNHSQRVLVHNPR